jgi:hypothetical protein
MCFGSENVKLLEDKCKHGSESSDYGRTPSALDLLRIHGFMFSPEKTSPTGTPLIIVVVSSPVFVKAVYDFYIWC